MINLIIIFGALAWAANDQTPRIEGAWRAQGDGNIQVLILADGHFALSTYNPTLKTFTSTRGGKYRTDGNAIVESVEFNTANPEQVGSDQKAIQWEKKGKDLLLKDQGGLAFSRIDDGGPGKLAGAWVITGRMSNGELRAMTPGARRTMKILSGARFQWIAYNVDTKEFSGTGGGTYTTTDGKYTENIEFFSRDNTRVGASLTFDFALENKTWRHRGLSSKGEPIDEVWSRRVDIGL
jgi:hypothetical protein